VEDLKVPPEDVEGGEASELKEEVAEIGTELYGSIPSI
jgi:hypothetical protein